ncbi:MAG: GNAT family N-acetyltransferase [Armatimonadota bacterium]
MDATAVVRTIREDETSDFLSLLCEVFNLDPARAESVFRNEPFFDLDRKWALFEGERMVSCLTTVPLLFADFRAIGIAGVATREIDRGKGFATLLLQQVLKESEGRDEGAALLFARDEALYRRAGFETLDVVLNVTLDAPEGRRDWETLPTEETQARYAEWARADKKRLLRDEQRWRFWSWAMKTVMTGGAGYVVCEPLRVRELLPALEALPPAQPREWLGLRSMTEQLGIPTQGSKQEMLLMGRAFPFVPQMFMTDQF